MLSRGRLFMRKFLLIFLATLLVFALCACSNSNEMSTNNEENYIIIDDEKFELSESSSSNESSKESTNLEYGEDNQTSVYSNSTSSKNADKNTSSYKKPENEPNKNNETNLDQNSNIVYRTPYGKRYHFDPDCGGKNSYTVSFDEALEAGLTPCKKCAM